MKAILVVKLFEKGKIMIELSKQVPAKPVPAAAVRQVGQALFEITGRKAYVGCI